MRKVHTASYEGDPCRILKYMSVVDNIVPAVPGIIGIYSGRYRILFRRLIFRFTDDYSIDAGLDCDDRSLLVEFAGEKSHFVILYKAAPGAIQVFAEYQGPRRWVVEPGVRQAARSILEYALEKAGRAPAEEVSGDLSGKLADLGWVTRLLASSVLVESIRGYVLVRGAFHRLIEDLHEKGLLDGDLVYVSGTGMGSFRLLFRRGELVGVYAAIGDRVVVGDPKALNELEGLYTVKVYQVLRAPREVERVEAST